MFHLCRYDGQYIRWSSYKTEASRDKWAAEYVSRGYQVNTSGWFNSNGTKKLK